MNRAMEFYMINDLRVFIYFVNFTKIVYIGDVILREQPYAAVLEAIFRANHCAHCMKKTPTPIPCYECSTVRP